MQDDRPNAANRQRPWLGPALAAAWVVLSLGWVLVVGVFVAVAMLLGAGGETVDVTALSQGGPLSGVLLSIATMLQFIGMLGLAVGVAWIGGRELGSAFAVRRAPSRALWAAVIGGLVVGVLPGKIAEELVEHLPEIDLGNLEAISDLLSSGSALDRGLLLLAVCVLAPVVEECVFRGFLFDALGLEFSPWVTWVSTSVLFAAYHVDPVHVIAVFFTGLFLGWLRWMSGSIWPSMIAHGINNVLAASVSIGFESDLPGGRLPWWAALLAAAATVGCARLARPKR